MNFLRAKTYEPVARGVCPRCGNKEELRFVYGGPDQDDFLTCKRCGEELDERMNDDAQTPGGVFP